MKSFFPLKIDEIKTDILHTRRGTAQLPLAAVITLCGSSRFKDELERLNRELTLAGNIVIAPGFYQAAEDRELTRLEKARLDVVHFHKIALSSAILVVNAGGHIDESTEREIEYAHSIGKPVLYAFGQQTGNAEEDEALDIPDFLRNRENLADEKKDETTADAAA